MSTEMFQGLDQASQKHEKEIVIELGPDRILHFVGVYLIILLAIIAKITEVTGEKLSCFPANAEKGFDANFIKYANTYCWESANTTAWENDVKASSNLSSNNETSGTCRDLMGDNPDGFLEDPTLVKRFIQWMPYLMFLQAFLFALPSAWWHFRVGARLMGHLKFMQLLLNDIYESVKEIPAGIYRRNPYEATLGCTWQISKKNSRSSVNRKRSMLTSCIRRLYCSCNSKSIPSMRTFCCEEGGFSDSSEKDGNTLLDRHMFSILCHENFSHLHHYPYISSIFKLTRVKKEKIVENDAVPLHRAFLRHWCNEKNFNGEILVDTYRMKHIFGIVISIIMTVIVVVIMSLLYGREQDTESFQCSVLFHEQLCMICIIHMKVKTFMFLMMNILIVFLHFVISVWQYCYIKRSINVEDPERKFFESISDDYSAALCAAFHVEKKKEDE